jgi:hypothetical protein
MFTGHSVDFQYGFHGYFLAIVSFAGSLTGLDRLGNTFISRRIPAEAEFKELNADVLEFGRRPLATNGFLW